MTGDPGFRREAQPLSGAAATNGVHGSVGPTGDSSSSVWGSNPQHDRASAGSAMANERVPSGQSEALNDGVLLEGKPLLQKEGPSPRPPQSHASAREQNNPWGNSQAGHPCSEPGFGGGNGAAGLRLLLWRFFRVAAAFFMGDAKWKARGLTALLVAFATSATYMRVYISYVQRDLTNALTEKHADPFYQSVWKYLAVCAFAAPFFGLYDYAEQLITLEWRVWLTELLLSKYFSKRAFFDLKMEGVLDNPDQRICEDVRDFVDTSVDVILLLVEKLLAVFAFSAVLWSISPPVVFFLLAYAAIGTYVSLRVFGRKIMDLKFQNLQREADMRYSLVRVRDNVESIAFYRGEHRESGCVRAFLLRVVSNVRSLLLWGFGLGVFTNAYDYATYLIPVLALAPRYFAGTIEYGDIVQTSIAFDQIYGAVTIIVLKLGMWAGLAAETERLESLLTALKVYSGDESLTAAPHSSSDDPPLKPKTQPGSLGEDGTPMVPLESAAETPHRTLSVEQVRSGSAGPTIQRRVGDSLAVLGLQILLPKTGEALFPGEGLSFSLGPTDSLLVMGPSGCGKSSLMRAISGLWVSGHGEIVCPPERDVFFLPQKPYMTIGSLREQLLFPLPAATRGSALDARLAQVLEEVHLQELLHRFPLGLDEVCDWADTLSVGEQQRIAFARILVRRPRMAFLDEATSALDAANERRLYSLIKQNVGSYVSVGHRPSLIAFHTHVMWFDEEKSSWTLQAAADFRPLNLALNPS